MKCSLNFSRFRILTSRKNHAAQRAPAPTGTIHRSTASLAAQTMPPSDADCPSPSSGDTEAGRFRGFRARSNMDRAGRRDPAKPGGATVPAAASACALLTAAARSLDGIGTNSTLFLDKRSRNERAKGFQMWSGASLKRRVSLNGDRRRPGFPAPRSHFTRQRRASGSRPAWTEPRTTRPLQAAQTRTGSAIPSPNASGPGPGGRLGTAVPRQVGHAQVRASGSKSQN